jgi:6-phosphogluconolactonase
MNAHWHVAPSLTDWLQYALAQVRKSEMEALAARGEFHLVLAGGSTPRLLYEALAREKHGWPQWHLWLGDERCLPVDHPDRNSRMVRESLLGTLSSASAQLHEITAESGPIAAAKDYDHALANLDFFDLVLLGLGEDGHTASLFPDQNWGETSDSPAALPVFNAPKPPPERVSLSARRLSRARRVMFLVNGASKQDAIRRWREGETAGHLTCKAIPASAIRPDTGCEILLTPDSLPSGVQL